MANVNNAHGLRPMGTNLAGGAPAITPIQKLVGNVNPIYRQDVVSRLAGGGLDSNGVVPGTTLLSGVALDYSPGSFAFLHLVQVSPDSLYEAQSDLSASGGTASLLATNMGLNANLAIAAGSALPPHLSGTQISATSAAVTATLDVHLLNLYADINNAFGNYCRIEIVINKHRMYGATAGV
jgi:hypothetical protein